MARASPSQAFRKGEVEEALIQDLRDIAYEYARPFTVDDVLEKALEYLATPAGKDAYVEISTIIDSSFKYTDIDYTTDDCDVCGGIKGCFKVSPSAHSGITFREAIRTSCSIKDVINLFHREHIVINDISMIFPNNDYRLYDKRHNYNVFAQVSSIQQAINELYN